MTRADRESALAPAVVGMCAILCIVVGTFGHGAPGMFLKLSRLCRLGRGALRRAARRMPDCRRGRARLRIGCGRHRLDRARHVEGRGPGSPTGVPHRHGDGHDRREHGRRAPPRRPTEGRTQSRRRVEELASATASGTSTSVAGWSAARCTTRGRCSGGPTGTRLAGRSTAARPRMLQLHPTRPDRADDRRACVGCRGSLGDAIRTGMFWRWSAPPRAGAECPAQ